MNTLDELNDKLIEALEDKITLLEEIVAVQEKTIEKLLIIHKG